MARQGQGTRKLAGFDKLLALKSNDAQNWFILCIVRKAELTTSRYLDKCLDKYLLMSNMLICFLPSKIGANFASELIMRLLVLS